MGDFLSNLTARTFQPTAQVQPRLPARFEPDHHRLAGLGQPMPLEALVEIEAPAAGSAPATQSWRNLPAHLRAEQPVAAYAVMPTQAAAQLAPAAAREPENKPAAGRAERDEPHARTSPVRIEPVQPLRDHALEQVEPDSRTVGMTQQAALHPLSVPTTAMPLLQQRPVQPEMIITPLRKEQSPAAVLPTSAVPVAPPPPSGPRPASDQDKVSGGPADALALPVQPAATAASAGITRPPQSRGVLTSPATRQANPFTEPQQASTQTQPAPVVNITIGRIEVRAAPPPVAAAKPAAAKNPTLSLDEYLRRRGVGGAA